MAALAFQLEKQVAVSAVLRACGLTSSVFNKLVKNETVTKEDKSPVTVADYSAQAVINTVISHAFPSDGIVGEEDANDLRDATKPETQTLRDRIFDLANEALVPPKKAWEKAEWGIGKARSIDQLLDAIDRGNYAGGRTGRMWVLDPIDGTKGFLRGEQYAVCLALVIDSIVEVGVIGCPNLLVSPGLSSERGTICVAVRGQGASQAPISALSSSSSLENVFSTINIPSQPPASSSIRTLESVESAHSAQGFTSAIGRALGLKAPPNRMDSQAKYCALARGLDEGHLYLRMPVPGKFYIEKIWDHAAGNVIVTEAGGVVSDSYGDPLDFGKGRTLGDNRGIIACASSIHERLVTAIKQAREEEAAGRL